MATRTAEWDRLMAVLAAHAQPTTADPARLLATPDAEVWYDPATAALVRIPARARRPTDLIEPDPDNFDPLNPTREP